MKATVPFIEEKVKLFNSLCFHGKLPPIPVKLTKARTFLGKVTFKSRRGFFGNFTGNQDFTLRISSLFDLEEREWEDVVLHELIHYHIAINGLLDSSVHGRLFRKYMNDINTGYGRNVTVRHRAKAGQIEPRNVIQRENVVCVSRLEDGNSGITVCAHSRVAYLKRTLPKFYRLKSMDWYLSYDSYFNKFPRSRTPKIYKITQEVLDCHLSEATRLN